MSNTYSVDAGAGVAPLTLNKAEDGSVLVDPLFSGIRIPEASLEEFAKFLLSPYEEPKRPKSEEEES